MAFAQLNEAKDEIKKRLLNYMPEYASKTWLAVQEHSCNV